MIGAAKIALNYNPSAPTPDLDAFISPSELAVITSNGSYTSPNITVTASGGTPPYTYAWSSDAAINISSASSQTINFSCSGYNSDITGTLTCVVTDDVAAEKNVDIPIFIIFGILP